MRRARVSLGDHDKPTLTPREVRRSKHLVKKYDLHILDYYEMWEGQGRKCAACREDIDVQGSHGSPFTACVDHCHSTGRVRGLLCGRCNLGIGHFEDNPGKLRLAAEYLQPHWDYLS